MKLLCALIMLPQFLLGQALALKPSEIDSLFNAGNYEAVAMKIDEFFASSNEPDFVLFYIAARANASAGNIDKAVII